MNNIVTMVALLGLGSTYGILGLAIAAVLGAACQFTLQLPILWEKRKFYSGKVDFRDSQLAQMGNLSFPLLISTGGNEVARVTDRIFASLLPGGSLSALAFAHRPTSVVIEFLIRPLQQATFPHFTKLAAERDFPTLSRQLFNYLRLVLFIALPATVGLMFTAEPIVQVLYQRGRIRSDRGPFNQPGAFVLRVGSAGERSGKGLSKHLFRFEGYLDANQGRAHFYRHQNRVDLVTDPAFFPFGYSSG